MKTHEKNEKEKSATVYLKIIKIIIKTVQYEKKVHYEKTATRRKCYWTKDRT